MSIYGRKRACRYACLLSLSLLIGCSFTGARNPLNFSNSHKLLDEVASVRQPVAPDVPRELAKQSLPAYVVEPGDVLLVYPGDLDSPLRLPGDQPVLPDGTIDLGRYGRLPVAGRALVEVETMVRATIAAQAPNAGFVGVRLISRSSKVYYVIGEVNSPGSFQLSGRETVLDGIIAAGGLTDRASRTKIILSRPTPPDSCRLVFPVCIREIVQLGDTTTNYQLAPGDRIYVPAVGCLESLLHTCSPCGGTQIGCPLPIKEHAGTATETFTLPAPVAAPPKAEPLPPPRSTPEGLGRQETKKDMTFPILIRRPSRAQWMC
jgi:protein involved in polysaccharide export with SLBB domain